MKYNYAVKMSRENAILCFPKMVGKLSAEKELAKQTPFVVVSMTRTKAEAEKELTKAVSWCAFEQGKRGDKAPSAEAFIVPLF